MNGRDAYSDVGRAMRAAVERARDADLTRGDYAVLASVFSLVSSYSRLVDRAYVIQVAQLAGVNDKTARRALKKLAERGVIVWQPRRGVGVSSLLGLPETGPLETRNETGQSSVPESGHPEARRKRASRGPRTEKTSEETLPRPRSRARTGTTALARDYREYDRP